MARLSDVGTFQRSSVQTCQPANLSQDSPILSDKPMSVKAGLSQLGETGNDRYHPCKLVVWRYAVAT
jgi:hypothetical protein